MAQQQKHAKILQTLPTNPLPSEAKHANVANPSNKPSPLKNKHAYVTTNPQAPNKNTPLVENSSPKKPIQQQQQRRTCTYASIALRSSLANHCAGLSAGTAGEQLSRPPIPLAWPLPEDPSGGEPGQANDCERVAVAGASLPPASMSERSTSEPSETFPRPLAPFPPLRPTARADPDGVDDDDSRFLIKLMLSARFLGDGGDPGCAWLRIRPARRRGGGRGGRARERMVGVHGWRRAVKV